MAAAAVDGGDAAPGLTVLNRLWWGMEDHQRQMVDYYLELYFNTDGYLKENRKQHHHQFHSQAHAEADKWGTHAASMSMPFLAPIFFKKTGSHFNQGTKHALMEAFFWHLRNQGHESLYQYCIMMTDDLALLQADPWFQQENCPELIDVPQLLDLREKFVEKLRMMRGLQALRRRFQPQEQWQ